jgi:hypothetical protein
VSPNAFLPSPWISPSRSSPPAAVWSLAAIRNTLTDTAEPSQGATPSAPLKLASPSVHPCKVLWWDLCPPIYLSVLVEIRGFYIVFAELREKSRASVHGAATGTRTQVCWTSMPAPASRLPSHTHARRDTAWASGASREQPGRALLVLLLLAWWRHHHVTYALWLFSLRKTNSEIL